jgi:hypothetical protein
MKIENLKDLKGIYGRKYTSVGCYPVFVLMSDSGVLCPDCVKTEYTELVDAIKRNDSTGGWLPMCIDVNWESPDLYCDHCSDRIESAYAEDEVL